MVSPLRVVETTIPLVRTEGSWCPYIFTRITAITLLIFQLDTTPLTVVYLFIFHTVIYTGYRWMSIDFCNRIVTIYPAHPSDITGLEFLTIWRWPTDLVPIILWTVGVESHSTPRFRITVFQIPDASATAERFSVPAYLVLKCVRGPSTVGRTKDQRIS